MMTRESKFFRRCSLAVTAGIAMVLVGCADDSPTSPDGIDPAVAQVSQAAMHEMIMLRQEGAPSTELVRAIEDAGGRIEQSVDEIGVITVSGLSAQATASIAARAEVESSGKDRVMQWIPTIEEFRTLNHIDPTDAFFFDQFQWNMRVTNSDAAYLLTPQGEGATVCVLDTGVDPTHLDLSGRVNPAKSAGFIVEDAIGETSPNFIDYNFHGTFVSALIAGNGLGMAAVAPHAEICAVKVLDLFGSGPFEGVISGIVFAALVGADVINMSLGVLIPRDAIATDPDLRALIRALQRAIRFANRQGALVVASSGNDGLNMDDNPDLIHVPSMLNGVLSVASTGPIGQMDFDTFAAYSNHGKSGVDIAAPGGQGGPGTVNEDRIFSACSTTSFFFACGSGASYLIGTGTSFAAPHVAGAAAVVESTKPGNQRAQRLKRCVLRGADDVGPRNMFGRGRVDVFDSVNQFGCGRSFLNGDGVKPITP